MLSNSKNGAKISDDIFAAFFCISAGPSSRAHHAQYRINSKDQSLDSQYHTVKVGDSVLALSDNAIQTALGFSSRF
jgi:hypothetical protein